MARYQSGIQTEGRIIEATRELLSEQGLEGTTLKAICDRAGVQAGSFYNLFPSKEAAVFHVVRESIDAVDPDPEGEGTDRVADLVGAYVEFVTDQPELARIYCQVALTRTSNGNSAGKRFLRHHERRVERFAAAISRETGGGLNGAPAADQAEVMLGALDGLAFRWTLDHTFDFPKYARLAAGLCR